MKNQYFGDIGDYKKYGIIRNLADAGALKVLVCWMLTESDGRSDGKFIQYLHTPAEWRNYEPDIFDFIVETVIQRGVREVRQVEEKGILHNTTFYSKILSDNDQERVQYFDELCNLSKLVDIVFLDPDNGIEIQSVKHGKKNSNKYIYWKEILAVFQTGCSVLIYQHFTRTDREKFIQDIASKVLEYAKAQIVFSLRTTHSVYFLASQPDHISSLKKALGTLNKKWWTHIVIQEHTPTSTTRLEEHTQLSLF